MTRTDELAIRSVAIDLGALLEDETLSPGTYEVVRSMWDRLRPIADALASKRPEERER